MSGMNKVMIMGHLGRDPELRSLKSGERMASFSVATSESWRDRQSGERMEKTEWHKVTVWPPNLVDLIEKYVRKGDMILIEGKLETRKWQDQGGQDRYSTEVVVRPFGGSITLIGKLASRDGGGYAGGGNSSGRLRDREPDGGYADAGAPPGAGQQRAGVNQDLDDEIPF